MKRYVSLLSMLVFSPLICVCACAQPNNGLKSEPEKVTLPDAFKNKSFAHVAGNWNECGAALIFDDKLNSEIQTVSSHNEFYDVDYDALPLFKKTEEKTMYFLPFKVTNQVIDDGYFKDGIEYKFWLSYEDSSFYCGVSKNDDSLKEPEMLLYEAEL